MKIRKLAFLFLASTVVLTSCSDDDDFNDVPLGAYDNGVLILNEGNFGVPNASISFLSYDMTNFQANAFAAVNPNITLGDVAQDIGFYDDYAFVVVNNSQKVEVLNRYTLEHVTSITEGFSNPRYIAFANGNAYVTNWGDGSNTEDDYVAVIDVNSLAVTATIPVAEGPEHILAENGNLYIAHEGGYGYGNSISVINASTNTVTTTIAVSDVPNSIVEEDNKLFVLCGGMPSWSGSETAGALVTIDLATNTVESTLEFSTEHPSNLVEENDVLYYTVDAGIYKTPISSGALATEEFFSITDQGVYGIYSFAVEDNKIFIGDAADYSANGTVYVYDINGVVLADYSVGVIPTGFYFN